MKPGFHHKLVNGWFGDPALYVRIPWEKRAILFDCGDLRNLSSAEIQKISDIFITHTHIDHFIGFETVLRGILRRELPLNVYGPSTITGCIEGKLKGYAWNLITEYPAVINVLSYSGKSVRRTVFRASNRFRKEMLGTSASDGVLLCDPVFSVRACRVDHDTPCLAYSLEEGVHINIDKAMLRKKGLPVGPWLSEFKNALRKGNAEAKRVDVGERSYPVSELAEIASITKGQKICYATDFAMTKRNILAVTKLVRDADVLYTEAFFLHKDSEVAAARYHLTAETAGKMARDARVKKIVVMHISPRYTANPDEVIREALQAFNSLSK